MNELKLMPGRDIIEDDRGNYYIVVNITENDHGEELILVNAYVQSSFKKELMFNDDFKKLFGQYDKKFIGQIAMDELKAHVERLKKGNAQGHIYPLTQVFKHYNVRFVDTLSYKQE